VSQNKQKHLAHLRENGGYFKKFEWMPDEFDRPLEFRRRDLINDKIKATEMHSMPFNPGNNKKLLKHEYPF